MKKNILFVFLLCFIVSFIACDDDEDESIIPSRGFKLPDKCWWDGDFKPEYIYRINSVNELEKLTTCNETIEIGTDFENNTLLFVIIPRPDPGHYIEYEMIKEKDSYILNIEVINGDGVRPMVAIPYNLAFWIEKLDNNIPIKLNIKR